MPIPNPVAFTLFGINIMWYGILIALGMMIGLTVAYKRAPLHGMPSERMLDAALICIPLAIIGARLYYVAFNWSDYAGNIFRIIDTRAGGLAIHGGLIFGLGAGIILCIRWRIHPFNALDLVAPGLAIAQSIGRWGNYFNSEAHGGPTNLPWAVTVNGQTYQPTFLYESIWCFLLFFLLIYVDNRRIFDGQTFLLYGILYSFERFFVEGLRTDSLMLGSFRVAQLISALVFVVFLIIYIVKWKHHNRKGQIFYQR